MKKIFLGLSFFLLFWIALLPEANAQCPTQGDVVLKTHTDISCFGANDGTITVDLADASTSEPFNFELFDLDAGSIVTFSVTEVEDKPNRSVVYSAVPPGRYSVLFFKAGCTTLNIIDNATLGFVIDEPPVLTLTGSDVVLNCGGSPTGSGSFTAGGGTPGYSFVVNSNTTGATTSTTATTLDFTGAGVGSIMVTVTDNNGCNVAHTINVTQPPVLTLGTTPDVLLACNGDMTATGTFTAGGGTPGYTFTVDSNTTGGTTSTTATTLDFTGAGVGSITVTVTDANSCTTQSTINVTQPPAVTLGTTPDVSLLCNGDTNGSGTFTAGGGTPGYSFVVNTNTTGGTTSTTATTLDFINAGVGSITVTVTDNNGCSVPATINVTEPTILTLTGPNVSTSCNGLSDASGSFTAGGGTPGYSFVVNSNTTGATTSTTATTLDFTGAGVGSIMVTVTDNNGCNVAHTINVTQPPALTLGTTPDVLLACNGDMTATGTFTAGGGTPGYTFTVDSNTTGGTTSTTASTLDFTGAGVGSITVTVTDANSCTTQSTINVTQPPAVTLGTTPDVSLLCNGDTNGSGTFTAGGGTPGYSFVVNTNTTGGTTSTTATTLDFINAGVGSITVTVTDNNGCSIPATINVTEPTILTLTGPNVSTSCNGLSDASGSFTAGGGTPGYSFVVNSNTTGATTSTTATTLDFTGAGVGSIMVTVTDNNGCNVAHTINVTQPPVLTLGTTPDVLLACNGDMTATGTFTAGGGTPGYTFTVDSNTTGGTTSTTASTLDFTGAGVGSITVTVTDANSCTTQSTINVTQPPAVTLGTTPDVSLLCNGDTNGSGTFTAGGGTPGYSFVVNTNTTGGTTSTTATTLDFINAGVGSITVTVTDNNGCSIPATINVTEPTILTLTGPNVSTSCNGLSDASGSFTAGGGTPGYSFVVNSNTTGATTSTTATTLDFTGAGVGSIMVTVTDNNGCNVAHTINVTQPPALTLGTTPDVLLACNGDMTATGTFTAGGGTPGYTFTVDSNTTGGTTSTTATTLDFTGAGVGSITVTVTDANSCTTQSTINVTQPPVLTLTPTPDVNLTCSTDTNATGIFTAAGGTAPYAFTVDANTTGGTTSTTATTLDFINGGAGLITVTVTDASACTSQMTINVIAPPPISAVISGNPNTCLGQNAALTVNFVGPGPTWNFTYTDGSTNFNLVANTNPFSFNVAPFFTTSYSLVSVTDATCGAGSVSGTATVTVAPVAGNPTTFGSETWLAYVYDDSGSPAPPTTNINYSNGKYRGFLNESEIASISAFSSYNTTTDAFNLNLTNTIPVAGPNICGSYLNDYSIRFRMTKTFAAGVYTFTVGADDGVRMFIDGGTNILTNPATPASFSVHGFTTYTSAPQCLTAGTHNLVIEYFDRGGFSRIDFNYSAAPAPTVTTPVSVCVNSPAPTLTASSAGALDYKWYTDAALTNPPIFTGASYTPAAAQLNMTVAGTTDFFVTAVYACGDTPAAQVTVDVTSGANIVLPTPPVQVCDVGGIIDLTTLVTATPIGGTFTFSGTGITTSPNFDPTGLSGTTSTISVNYISGTCNASTTFDIDVVGNATITSATATVCESAGVVDLNTLVSGNPTGGAFTFSGTGVTASNFDPSGLSGLTTITVDYNVGGCAAPTQMFDIDVIPNVSLVVDNSTVVCPAGGMVDLAALVTPTPTGGTFTFTGTGVTGTQFDPSGSAGSTVSINVSYDVGGCTAASTVQVMVRAAADLLCGGPTGNCATVIISPVATAAICSPTDGRIMFNITPATPTINNTGVRIDIVGTSTTNLGVALTNFNDPLFTGLPVGTYNYTIEYGDPGCIKLGQVTVLLGPDVVDFTVAPNSVNCFGTAGGVVLSNINGSSMADYTYEVTQSGSVVLSGTITQLASLGDVTVTGVGSGNFEIKLSQDQSATTSCTSPVQSALKPFTVTSPAASLDTLYVIKKISVPDLPTGSMLVGIEESLQEPYEVRLELTQPLFPGQVFAQDFTVANRNPLNLKVEFQAPNLYAGGYQLSLRDALGCRKDYLVNIAVDNNLMIPNIFTPNGDGVNEVFFIRNMPDATEVIVSNRWGKQVYASKNYQNDWDGGDTADGVYYYRIKAGGQSYSGWVEVLRGQ